MFEEWNLNFLSEQIFNVTSEIFRSGRFFLEESYSAEKNRNISCVEFFQWDESLYFIWYFILIWDLSYTNIIVFEKEGIHVVINNKFSINFAFQTKLTSRSHFTWYCLWKFGNNFPKIISKNSLECLYIFIILCCIIPFLCQHFTIWLKRELKCRRFYSWNKWGVVTRPFKLGIFQKRYIWIFILHLSLHFCSEENLKPTFSRKIWKSWWKEMFPKISLNYFI